jgi:nicotinamide-nucleotide amidase
VITVGVAPLASGDDAGALRVIRALQDEGLPVAARETVDESEVVLERTLELAVEDGGLVVVLAQPGGSAGEVVRRVLARLAVARLVLHDRVLAAIEAEFAARGQAMPRRLDRLALLPQGVEVWPAPTGEPGWALAARRALVAVLPLGSPHLDMLVDRHLRAVARDVAGTGPITLVRTLRTAGVGPAEVEERLAPWLGREGPVTVTCVPAQGEVWARLVARAPGRALAAAQLAEVEVPVRAALGEHCYGRDGDALEAVVGALLQQRGLTLSTAESCTGGLVAHRITNVPGSSRYFDRGVVVYSNEAKEALLGVPGELLRAHGAVSAPVAEAMARGACRVGGSSCAVAITGIAGPGGGTPDKPVGLVFVAAAAPAGLEVRRFHFAGDREAIKRQSAHAALDLLRRLLGRDGRSNLPLPTGARAG